MDHPAGHADQPQPATLPADRMAQLHALVDDFVAHGQQLRTLHERYMALQHEGESKQRRDDVQDILKSELSVLADSQRIHQQIDQFLRAEHDTHWSRMGQDARQSEGLP
jgi:hypothetical protein